MTDELLQDIRERLDCLILLNCSKDSPEKERLKVAVNCLGLAEAARLLGKDPSNLSKQVRGKWIRKVKQKGVENVKKE
jgi:hypothetical protein